MTARGTSAAAVSATLRRGGLLPTPRDREGVHVTGRDPVRVVIDVDLPRLAVELANAAETILLTAGYVVTRRDLDASLVSLAVTR